MREGGGGNPFLKGSEAGWQKRLEPQTDPLVFLKRRNR